MHRVSDEIIEGLKDFDTPTVFNAMVKKLGLPNEEYTSHEIRCLTPCPRPVIGYAVTAEVTSMDLDSPGISWRKYYGYLEENPGPHFCVMKDVDSRPGRGASFGDGMATMHKRFGAVAVVVEGTVRDLPGINVVGMPTWAWGSTPGHGATYLTHVNTPITVGQLRIRSGDLMMGDEGGCVRIAIEHVEDILRLCHEVRDYEKDIMTFMGSPECTVEELNRRTGWDERAKSMDRPRAG
jgi:regulator of RNase E activity RraA